MDSNSYALCWLLIMPRKKSEVRKIIEEIDRNLAKAWKEAFELAADIVKQYNPQNGQSDYGYKSIQKSCEK